MPRIIRYARPAMHGGVAFVLDQSLRLLHTFVPYITEGLWNT